jgi:outer membrane protein TolC
LSVIERYSSGEKRTADRGWMPYVLAFGFGVGCFSLAAVGQQVVEAIAEPRPSYTSPTAASTGLSQPSETASGAETTANFLATNGSEGTMDPAIAAVRSTRRSSSQGLPLGLTIIRAALPPAIEPPEKVVSEKIVIAPLPTSATELRAGSEETTSRLPEGISGGMVPVAPTLIPAAPVQPWISTRATSSRLGFLPSLDNAGRFVSGMTDSVPSTDTATVDSRGDITQEKGESEAAEPTATPESAGDWERDAKAFAEVGVSDTLAFQGDGAVSSTQPWMANGETTAVVPQPPELTPASPGEGPGVVPDQPVWVDEIGGSPSDPSSMVYQPVEPSGQVFVAQENYQPALEAIAAPEGLIEQAPAEGQTAPSGPQIPRPYWYTDARFAMKASPERAAAVEIEVLIWAALAHSPYIKSIQTQPLILESEIQSAEGVFDPTRFASSIWHDTSDPVGNTLTTGGPNRFNEHFLDNKAGVRKKNDWGGNWEAAQEVGLRDNNSVFFVPRQQADSRMVLRYSQPLMKGFGKTYNRASITVAQLNFEASNHKTNRAMQTHLFDITEAYWDLVYHRSLSSQLLRGIARLQSIHTQLQNRADLDLIQNQLLRASSAINGLQARYARSIAQIVQAEERLRQLVNAPWIQAGSCDEIVPTTEPLSQLVPLFYEQEVNTALTARSDLLAVRDQIKAANVRLRVAQEDLRPTLNMVTDFYVRGLNGNYDVANSFADQYAAGAPSYSGGLEYLRPKNQMVANAIRRQRDLEMRQLLFELEDRLLQTTAEVKAALAAIEAAYAELEASASATLSSQAEVEYLDARWQHGAFLEPTQVSLSLEQLLDAEQRLVQSEGLWASSQSQYMISLAKLRFVVGDLMAFEPTAP